MGPVYAVPQGGGVRCGSTDGLGGTASGVEGGLQDSGSVDVDSVLSRKVSWFSFVSVVSSDSVDLMASVLSLFSVGLSVSISILKRFSVVGISCVPVIRDLGT